MDVNTIVDSLYLIVGDGNSGNPLLDPIAQTQLVCARGLKGPMPLSHVYFSCTLTALSQMSFPHATDSYSLTCSIHGRFTSALPGQN